MVYVLLAAVAAAAVIGAIRGGAEAVSGASLAGTPVTAADDEAPAPAAPESEAAEPVRNPHANGADPHAASAVTLDVKPVPRAEGDSGRTVAELIAQRTQLAGKTVRIHATVVKSTPGVLGKTYLHLRDGTGDAASGTNDVAVTTDTTPAVGDTVLVEGVVAVDRDIGAGYKFPTLVEDARVLVQP